MGFPKSIQFSPGFIATILPVLLLLPFVGKAYHIDDVMYLWAAQQIQSTPADFYGFIINWYGYEQLMHEANQNPPLLSYYLAFVTAITGWSEISVHFWLLVPAVLFSLGVLNLAKILSLPQVPAVLITILSPVYLISSTTVMTDVTMSAFFVWAVWYWLRGMSGENHLNFIVSSVLICCAVLTKYFALSLVPLLFAYTLWEKKQLKPYLLYLIIPVLCMCLFEYLTYLNYGHGLLFSAAGYTLSEGGDGFLSRVSRIFNGFVFVGGCLLNVLFLTFFLLKKKWLASLVLFIILFSFVAVQFSNSLESVFPFLPYLPRYVSLQYFLYLTIGATLVYLSIYDFLRFKDPASSLVVLWVMGCFLFLAVVNWSVTARNVLPMLPALALIVARRFDGDFSLFGQTKFVSYSIVFLPAMLLSLMFVKADVAEANNQRQAAEKIATMTSAYKGQVWFFGHWGFQYYMERNGAKPYADKKTVFQLGDIVVMPTNNTNINAKLSKKVFWPVMEIEDNSRWTNVMQPNAGAGFYSDRRGPMPLNIYNSPPDKYYLYVFGNFGSLEAALSYVQANGFSLQDK